MSKLIQNRSKFKPSFKLPLREIEIEKEDTKNNDHNDMLIAYNGVKKIYWTSLKGIIRHIKSINTPTIIINLTNIKDKYQCNPPIVCVNIELVDTQFGGTVENIIIEFSNILTQLKDWYTGKYENLIIHCLQGQHRSFSLATLLSLFILNKDTDNILTVDDFKKYAENLQQTYNEYVLTPTYITNEQFNKLYEIFKIMFKNI